jgi:membrane protein required for colicin V production
MIIDICVGVVALLSALISFMRGFIREVLTIAGVVGGLAAAYAGGPQLSPVFRGWLGVGTEEEPAKLFDIVPMSVVADVSAYALIFVIVVIIISIISHFTAGAAKAMGLGPIDRTLGVVFGLARALVLLGLLYLPFHLLMDPDTKKEIFEGSRTHLFIERTAEVIAGFLPESSDVEKTGSDAATSFKDKLLQQDLLKGEGKPEDKTIPEKDAAPKPGDAGYQEKQREKMDQLFEQPTFNE